MLVALLALQLVLNQYNLSQARADTTSTMCVLHSLCLLLQKVESINIRVHQYVQCIGRALRVEAGGPSLAPLVVGRRINVSIIQTSAKMPRLTASSGATPLLRQITVAIISPPPPPPTYPTLVWFCILHSNEVQIFYRPQGNSARWECMYLLTHLEEIHIVRSPSLIFDHKRTFYLF